MRYHLLQYGRGLEKTSKAKANQGENEKGRIRTDGFKILAHHKSDVRSG